MNNLDANIPSAFIVKNKPILSNPSSMPYNAVKDNIVLSATAAKNRIKAGINISLLILLESVSLFIILNFSHCILIFFS
ncbi:hypothetical protein CFSAN002367_20372 [Clostridium botulinum CFSAN002367]|nr:hypothetical protein CFSAN002367_20372 [Clostridium botulinum CFSAN002367]EPS48808.1 hypothetical protein CFSAN002369_15190 [Clostridium botulinum CFSAN002369]